MSTETSRYNEDTLHAKFRAQMMEGSVFVNYGIAAEGEDTVTSIKEANLNMVKWLIKRLNITKNSKILEIGCGKGGYTLEIARQTGCLYTGIDIIEDYVTRARALARDLNLDHLGTFHVAGYEDVGPSSTVSWCRDDLTHILCLGSFLYVQSMATEILTNLNRAGGSSTSILLWDFERQVPWDRCTGYRKHLHLDSPIMGRDELVGAIATAGLNIVEEVDLTPRVIPSLERYAEESLKVDPTGEILTYPHMLRAFKDGEVRYKTWILRKE